MKTWATIGLALMGAGHGLLSGSVAFAEEESPYCAKARKLQARDDSVICGMAPIHRSCTTTVDGKTYRGNSYGCESPLTGLYHALCRDEVTDHSPLHFECCSEETMQCYGSDE